MQVTDVHFMLAYDAWATDQVLAVATRLSADAYALAPAPGQVAVRATLLHSLDGMRTWRQRLHGDPETAPLTEAEVPTPARLRALVQDEHARLHAYLAGLGNDDLGVVLEQRRPDRVVQAARWQLLQHIVMHNMQHRSEVAQALTLLGYSPGELGLTAFLGRRAQQDMEPPSAHAE